MESTFNRTSVELKQKKCNRFLLFFETFNRTSVELKREIARRHRLSCHLLIEPVWN